MPCQRGSRVECRVERRADGQDRHIITGAPDSGLAKGDRRVICWHTVGLEGLDPVVQPLAFEHHGRVIAGQRRRHQPLGIMRRRRIDHAKSGHMRDERRPVLGMLRPVFRPGRYAEHHRQAQLAGRHRLPFGELVENLITGPADEIRIHQLDNRPPAGKRITDRRRYDRRL